MVLGSIVLSLFLFLWGRNLQAPMHVRDKASALLLSPLLSHSVPAVAVDQIASEHVHILDVRAYREFEVSPIEGTAWVGYDHFDVGRSARISCSAF